MAIEKLIEFAKDGQKNTDDLNLTDGFHVSKKPARQWFNWLFNSLTSKVNEIIDADFVPKADIVDNLTTDDAKRPVSAKQAKALQDTKLGKTENAASATKLQTARTIGGVSFDGSANINLPGVNASGNQNTSGNAASATDCSRSVIAGNGLSGGGALTSNRTVTLGTPGNITATSTNSVTETSHTHNLDVNSLPFLGTGINKRKSIISGTTYTNTGNRPIFVTCSMSGSSSNAASATLDGRLIFSTNSSNYYSQSFVVGIGVSYGFTGNGLVCEEYS
jgi:hypothetical protein